MSKLLLHFRSAVLPMRNATRARAESERGAITAEYAAVTAAGAGFVGILISILTSDWGKQLLMMLFKWGLSLVGISL